MSEPIPETSPDHAPTGGMRILMVDDDRELCALITAYLAPLGYDLVAVHDGKSGVTRALAEEFEAIILDIMLPGMDGFEVLSQIRGKLSTPILMLTARGEETDRIVGLEMGADDYLPKTFSPRELLARLRAVTRRATRAAAAVESSNKSEICVGPLRMRLDTRQAMLDGNLLRLTTLEFELLACLAQARGRVKSREQLIETVSGRGYDGLDRSIDVHIWSLRKKLGDDPKEPRFIKTIRAIGYLLINPAGD